MHLDRRAFLASSAAAVGASACSQERRESATGGDSASVIDSTPQSIQALKPMTVGVTPITADERAARVEKARKLMADHKLDAIYLEGGSSMFYFTGVRWGLSERPFVCVIPAKGPLGWVCPAFEEERARELVKGEADIRVWEEDESPYRQIAAILKDRGAGTGRVGVEERLRFFIFSGVKKEAPGVDFADAEVVTAGCRMYKSPAEIGLMQRAMDITIAAYRPPSRRFVRG